MSCRGFALEGGNKVAQELALALAHRKPTSARSGRLPTLRLQSSWGRTARGSLWPCQATALLPFTPNTLAGCRDPPADAQGLLELWVFYLF